MNNFLHKIVITIVISLMTGFLGMPGYVFAESVELIGRKQGGNVVVDVLLTANESVNAVEGTLFLDGFSDVTSNNIQDGKSIINFWVQQPTVNENRIDFSGIVPGGFTGSGSLFSFVLPDTVTNGTVITESLVVLKNDGMGTALSLELPKLAINANTLQNFNRTLESVTDRVPPEIFYPLVAQSDDVFKGDYIVTFIAQDKNSGIKKYRIKEYRFHYERFFSRWRSTMGPYEKLHDQSLKSTIAIQAIDKSGNIRTVIVPPQNKPFWYDSLLVKIIIGSILILIIYRVHKKI